MQITIISGSHREPSQSFKVASFISQQLKNKNIGTEILSLANNPLPLWDQTLWENNEDWNQRLTPWRNTLTNSDAFVVITPEWHGQVPAGLKNFFLLFGKNELGHKPALITAVSSGDGGAYPIAELRMSSYKNNRICYIPEQLIIRNVETVLNDDPADNNESAHGYFVDRINWSLDTLEQYAQALKAVRANIDYGPYGNGM